MLELIKDKKILLAIIIKKNFKSSGIKFFTPNQFSQQLGYMNRPTGYKIKPHVHNRVIRKVEHTNEVLFIKSGKLRVDFYNKKKVYLKSKILNKGDVILLVRGGHGFEILKNSEIIEVKQGPYISEVKDKSRFKSISKNKINIE